MKEIVKQLQNIEKLSFELQPLRDIPILDNAQIANLSKISQELSTAFKTSQLGRPKYLMRVSVLKDMKFPTPDAKFWQAILERNIQFQNLLFDALDFQEKLADLEALEADIEELDAMPASSSHAERKFLAQRMKLDVQRRRMLLQLLLLKKQARERYREIMAWTDIIKELQPQLKYPPDDPEAHMPESFLLRFAHQRKIIDQIGAADMDGALNIFALGQSAARYWKQLNKQQKSDQKVI